MGERLWGVKRWDIYCIISSLWSAGMDTIFMWLVHLSSEETALICNISFVCRKCLAGPYQWREINSYKCISNSRITGVDSYNSCSALCEWCDPPVFLSSFKWSWKLGPYNSESLALPLTGKKYFAVAGWVKTAILSVLADVLSTMSVLALARDCTVESLVSKIHFGWISPPF